MDMRGWILLRSDRQEVPASVYDGQDLIEVDLSDVPDVSQELHWHAPQAYLGDKVSLCIKTTIHFPFKSVLLNELLM